MLKINRLKRLGIKGFTLVEMLVVITIMTIVLGASAWGVTGWILHSEYLKNEGNAQTIYLAAQSYISGAKSRGVVDQVFDKIKAEADDNGGNIAKELKAAYGLPTGADNELQNHEYAYLTVKNGDYVAGGASALFDIISPYIHDTEALNGAITIEFDLTSKSVYSVFYSSWAQSMEYGAGTISARGKFYISSATRPEEIRSDVAMGYYAVDQVNVAILDAETLRLTDISLNNEETLNLRFGSTSKHNELDTTYALEFYKQDVGSDKRVADDAHFLFSTVIDYSKIISGGAGAYKTSDGKVSRKAVLPVTTGTGSTTTTVDLPFVLSYNGSNYELVLDAMNTSQSYAALGLDSKQLYSITRILNCDPMYIFADVTVLPTADALNMREYSVSSNKMLSNTENDMFASELTPASGDGEYKVEDDGKDRIGTFRHLSNIRYIANRKDYLVTSDMDWNENIVYSVITSSGGNKPVDVNAAVFPTVPELKNLSTFDGMGHIVNNLRLSEESSVEYDTSGGATLNNIATKLGIFGINNGDISKIAMSKATLTVGSSDASGSATKSTSIYNNSLKSIGVLTGVNAGSISEVYFDEDCNLYADIKYNADGHKASSADGIGMLAGAMDVTRDNQVDRVLVKGKVTANVSGNGVKSINGGKFTFANIEADDGGYRNVGVGGVCGYICTVGTAASTFGISKANVAAKSYSDEMKQYFEDMEDMSIKNEADVSGNMFIGGVVGNLYSENAYSNTRTDITMQNCHNDAKISVTEMPKSDELLDMEKENPSFASLSGLYVGGIVGYNYRARISDCSYDMSDEELIAGYESVTSGNAELQKDREGVFVGGITGFSYDGTIYDCKTVNGGYLLGYDYVGGIIGSTKATGGDTIGGGTGGSKRSADNNTLVKDNVNGSYVVGHSFVGGIIGMNTAGVSVLDTANNGIAVGDGIDIGGIAGRNSGNKTKRAEIVNCSAKLNDYGSELFNMVKDVWQFYGSNVGGQVGFNEYGLIEFNTDSNSVKAVSSIAVGDNNVGGFVGYNGINGAINLIGKDEDYVSGKVYGTGDCVGGFIGINLAPEAVSEQKINISTISVEGNRMVGGVIGANILSMSDIASNSSFNIKYTNSISKIKGIDMVGGLIGYNELTKNSEILPASNVVGTTTFAGVDSDDWYTNIVTLGNYGIYKSAGKLSAESDKTFTIGQATVVDFNNAEVYAERFGGGLIGMSDENSKTIVKNARNLGQIKEEKNVDKVDISGMFGLDGDYADINSGIFGGIIGYATKNTVVDTCDSRGSLQLNRGGYGGVVGLNEGYVVNCYTSTNVGETTMSVIGGIAGINHSLSDAEYSIGTNYTVHSGEIKDCYNGADITVAGKNHIGGVCGINAGILNGCYALGDVRGKVNVGGITGVNLATIKTAGALDQADTLTVIGNTNVGGIVGTNDKAGVYDGRIVYASGNASTGDKAINVTAKNEHAGGIVGYLKSGTIKGDTDSYIKNYAKVKADNYAGGIVGYMPANIPGVAITCSENVGEVSASNSYAGGIVSVNDNNRITYSNNCGSVSASFGYAGGIASENQNGGYINKCRVYSQDNNGIRITSSEKIGGGVVAINNVNCSVLNCSVSTSNHEVTILGNNLKNIGYMVGKNEGMISGGQVLDCVNYTTSITEISLGGIAGYNTSTGVVKNIGTEGLIHKVKLTNNGNIKYLGGIVGDNEGSVIACVYSGEMTEAVEAAKGHAYGGIVGINHNSITPSAKEAVVSGDSIKGATIDVIGTSALDSGQSAKSKLHHTSFVGGIVGYNAEGVTLRDSYIESGDQSKISATYGMVGGIAGANAGSIIYCGYSDKMKLVDDVYDNLSVRKYGKTDGSDAGINRLNMIIGKDKKYASITATDSTAEADMDAVITMKNGGDGYLGGISGYNSVNGIVSKCASGKWKVVSNLTSKPSQIAGVVAQNESEKEFSYNVNCAFVLRNVTTPPSNNSNNNNTLYHVGGVICSMQNRTASGWVINGCVNIGSVVDNNSHNCAGIISNWLYNGGTVEYSFNYGTLKTNYQFRETGTVAGIVGLINGLTSGQTVNVVTCQNHGVVNKYYGDPLSSDRWKIANDVGGIVSEISAPTTDELMKINVIDCVNGADAEVYGFAKAIGILSWVGGDTGTTKVDNVHTNIIRCRNYSDNVKSHNNSTSANLSFNRCAGIFGSHGSSTKSTVVIKNCFSVNNQNTGKDNQIGQIVWCNSRGNGYDNAQNQSLKDSAYNYIIDKSSFNKVAEVYNNESNVNTVSSIGAGDYINTRNTRILKTYPDGDIEHGGSARRLYIAKNLSKSGSYVAVLDNHDFVESTNSADDNPNMKTLYPDLKLSYVRTGVSVKNVAKENSYIDETGGNHNYGVIKRKDSTSHDFDNTAQVLLKFKDQNGNEKPDIGDITDEVIQAYYEDYLEADGLNAPTITSLVAKEGGYSAEWTDPNTATEHYVLETSVYEVDEGTMLNKSNIGSFKPISTKEYKYYRNDGTFVFPDDVSIKSGKSYYVSARVKAVGSKKSSEYSSIEVIKHVLALPKPDVQLVIINGKWYYRLVNLSEYANYEDWQVDVKIVGKNSNQTLTAAGINPVTGISTTPVTLVENKQGVLRATASINGAGESAIFTSSIATVVKNYTGGSVTIPDESFKTVNSTEFEYNVKLKFTGKDGWPRQIFDLELYATNTETGMVETIANKEVALAYNVDTNVSLTIDDIVSGVDITKYDNFKVAYWYASTGLGPVYQYYDITDADTIARIDNQESGYTRDKGYIKRLLDDGTAEYYYVNSLCYGSKDYKSSNHYHECTTTIKYLGDIVIENDYVTTFDKDNNTLSFTYKWTGNYPGYKVKLVGIKSSGAEEEIDTSGYNGTSEEITLNADEWDYQYVRLEVTGVTTDTSKLAKSAKHIYDDIYNDIPIPRRLAKLDSPFVSLNEQDGLKYTIRFSESEDPECVGYQVYIQDVTDNGPITKLGDEIVGKSTTSTVINLEDYAEHKVKLMVVAKAPKNQSTVKIYDSVYGTPLTVIINGRLEAPKVSFAWSANWTSSSVVKESEFVSSKNTLNATVANPEQFNTYLLYGLVYKNKADADAALAKLNSANTDNKIMKAVDEVYAAAKAQNDTFIFGFGGTKKVADVKTLGEYTLSMREFSDSKDWSVEYAGYYILPLIRATSNTGVSSTYAWKQVLALPKVKLNSPTVNRSTANVDVNGGAYAFANYAAEPNQELTTKMTFDTYTFTRADEIPDYHQINLTANLDELDDRGKVQSVETVFGIKTITTTKGNMNVYIASCDAYGDEVNADDINTLIKKFTDPDDEDDVDKTNISGTSAAATYTGVTSSEAVEAEITTTKYVLNDGEDELIVVKDESVGTKTFIHNGRAIKIHIKSSEDPVSVDLVGYTNYITGNSVYSGGSTRYCFKADFKLEYEKKGKTNKYTLTVPKPRGTYEYDYVSNGTAYKCTGSSSANVVTKGEIVAGRSETTRLMSSDGTEMKLK